MKPAEIARRVGVFAVILIVVIAGGVAFVGGGDSEPTETPEINTLNIEAYSSDTIATAPAENGEIEMTADASEKVILIDASHGASMDREQLTPLVETLTENGAEVRFLSARGGPRPGPGDGSPFNASLRKADAFIAFGAEQQYTQSQVDGLEAFADAGGRVLIAKEPPEMQIRFFFFGPRDQEPPNPMPLTPLLSRFGVSVGNGYLYNMHQYDNNYRNVYATPTDSGHLTQGVDRLVLHESTPVRGPTTVMRTTERTELSETRKQDRYGVVVRSGNMTAVGDTSVFGQAYYRRGDNEVFVGNMLDFLVSGQKMPENAPVPPEPPGGGNETQMPPRGLPP